MARNFETLRLRCQASDVRHRRLPDRECAMWHDILRSIALRIPIHFNITSPEFLLL